MKTLIHTTVIILVLLTSANIAQTADSMKVLTDYSLFSEYHKNKDYESALPYGWKVIEAQPTWFSKWIYYKMEECFWSLHDSSSTAPEMVKSIQDTILYFYDIAIKYREEDKGYFQARKAYVSELWLASPATITIPEYEQAITWQQQLSSFYYDRLGQLYKNNDTEENGYKLKALELYNILSDREPENETWPNRKKELVDNIDELKKIVCDSWARDPENVKKAKECASICIQASEWEQAAAPLEFLVSKEPENIGFLTQLGNVYNKLDNSTKSEEIFAHLIKLEPDNKEHYFYFGKALMDAGKSAQARTQFLKASEVGNGWALPIYYEGLLYEQSAANCTEFHRQVVYYLAQITYRKALNMDANLTEAKDRINALSGAIPKQEDYFFRNLKSGDTVPITCVGWIGKSITVP